MRAQRDELRIMLKVSIGVKQLFSHPPETCVLLAPRGGGGGGGGG
eukprot:COSAG06_NODE_15887_length_1037_cov_1.375267_2_plen_44_part_01